MPENRAHLQGNKARIVPLLQGVASRIEFNTTFVVLIEVEMHPTGCEIVAII